jgi:hypothetical protein
MLESTPEYKVHVEQVRWSDTRTRERRMNELGAEGWQLTATSPSGLGYTNLLFQRLKRPGRAPTPPSSGCRTSGTSTSRPAAFSRLSA